MAFVEMDRSRNGNRYAQVIQDYLTKWPEVYPLPDHKAETVARCLVDITWKHGVPSRIIHDRATEFLAEVLEETVFLLGLTLIADEVLCRRSPSSINEGCGGAH